MTAFLISTNRNALCTPTCHPKWRSRSRSVTLPQLRRCTLMVFPCDRAIRLPAQRSASSARQAYDGVYTAATDLYAAGALFYELMTPELARSQHGAHYDGGVQRRARRQGTESRVCGT